MNKIINSITKRLGTFFSSAWTMKLDLLSLVIFVGALSLTGKIAGMFEAGWAVSNLLYAIAIAATAVHLPWLFIALAFPNSLNRFVNTSWDAAWERMNDSHKLLTVLALYGIFVAVFAVIAWAVFIGVPVGG